MRTPIPGKNGGTGPGWAATFKDEFEPVHEMIEVSSFGSDRVEFIKGRVIGVQRKGVRYDRIKPWPDVSDEFMPDESYWTRVH